MTAVEVLEWLVEHYYDNSYPKVFEADYNMNELLIDTEYSLSPQEIVDRIERYEAKKNELVSNSDEFKVGDWVEYSIFYYDKKYSGTAKILEIGQAEITGNVVYGIMLSEIDKVVFASANELKHLIFKVGDHVREIPAKPFEFDVVKVEGNRVYFSENNSIEAKYLEHAEPPKEENKCENCPKYDRLSH